MAFQPDLTTEIGAILDTAMRDYDLRNDSELARHLKVTPTAITKWRRGKISPSARALVPLLIQQHQIDVTKPRRRKVKIDH